MTQRHPCRIFPCTPKHASFVCSKSQWKCVHFYSLSCTFPLYSVIWIHKVFGKPFAPDGSESILTTSLNSSGWLLFKLCFALSNSVLTINWPAVKYFQVYLNTFQVLRFDVSPVVTFMLLPSHLDFLWGSCKPLLMGNRHWHCVWSACLRSLKVFHFLHTFYLLLQKWESFVIHALFLAGEAVVSCFGPFW